MAAAAGRVDCGRPRTSLYSSLARRLPGAIDGGERDRGNHEEGRVFHEIIERDSGRTLYFWDTEGNYEELHAGHPES